MAGVNKVILVGNLGADPESRSFSNGGEVVNLRIATSDTWKAMWLSPIASSPPTR